MISLLKILKSRTLFSECLTPRHRYNALLYLKTESSYFSEFLLLPCEIKNSKTKMYLAAFQVSPKALILLQILLCSNQLWFCSSGFGVARSLQFMRTSSVQPLGGDYHDNAELGSGLSYSILCHLGVEQYWKYLYL